MGAVVSNHWVTAERKKKEPKGKRYRTCDRMSSNDYYRRRKVHNTNAVDCGPIDGRTLVDAATFEELVWARLDALEEMLLQTQEKVDIMWSAHVTSRGGEGETHNSPEAPTQRDDCYGSPARHRFADEPSEAVAEDVEVQQSAKKLRSSLVVVGSPYSDSNEIPSAPSNNERTPTGNFSGDQFSTLAMTRHQLMEARQFSSGLRTALATRFK